MTVEQFQNIGRIEAENTIDHIGYAICELYNLTPKQVDNLPRLVQLFLTARVAKQLAKVRKPKWLHPKFTTNAEQINLGQFIEVTEWIKRGIDDNLHLFAASILQKQGNHKKDAAKILKTNIRKVLPYVEAFMQSYIDLTLKYEGLFEGGKKDESEETHPFLEDFGWMFTTKQIAEYLGVTVHEAYKIGIIEGLNIMAYLKTFNDYQEWQNKEI